MSVILYTGDDWVTGGVITDTTLIYSDFDDIIVKVIVNGQVRKTLSKIGGEVVQGNTNKEFVFTVDGTDTAKFPCGSVIFQVQLIANGDKQTSQSDIIELKKAA